MTISIIIPTKNRPKELFCILNSINKQSHLPNQLIVVDQSNYTNVIEEKFYSLFEKKEIKLNYIHDETIKGLVSAKSRGIKFNSCDIITFFDDDVVLEPNYLEEIIKAFKCNPNIYGVNGLILNTSKNFSLKGLIYRITHFGIFKDNRPIMNRKALNGYGSPIMLNALSGGLSSWRKEIFQKVKFDNLNKFHSLEDIDFSIRFNLFYPNSMFLIPKAKLYHFHASPNRASINRQISNHVQEIILLFKKNKNFSFLGIDLFFILIYFMIIACFLGVKQKNINFLTSFLKGIREGFLKKAIKIEN